VSTATPKWRRPVFPADGVTRCLSRSKRPARASSLFSRGWCFVVVGTAVDVDVSAAGAALLDEGTHAASQQASKPASQQASKPASQRAAL
jgi:hypothetical protein